MLKIRPNFTGGLITFALSFLIIFIFFFDIFKEPNLHLFAPHGDGMKSTFCSLYHIEYDTSFWKTEAMNYPYGESVFFTGNQVFLTNFIKLTKNTIFDLTPYSIGIFNIWLLLSFAIGSLFLYLILKKFEISDWFAIPGALLIIFLSPQWDRLGGHFNLAYAWAFPIGIYLIIEFYEKAKFRISWIISIFMFILCGKHLYFLVLNGILIAFVFTRLFFYENKRFGGKGKLLIHFGIQLLLPFVLFSLFTSFYDQNIDRTAYPWGFFQSVTRIEGIFLPLKLPYGQFISIKGSLKTVAFVGLIPALMFIFIKIRMVRVGINRGFKESLNLTGNPTLNLLYWGAFLAFLISLGIPFTLGLENLLNYTGPFRQFRAIGRFILPFYYLLNILSIFFLHKWFFQSGKQYLQVVVLHCLVWFSFDAYLNVKHASNAYINRFEILSLENSAKGDYDWVERHNWENYQVLMPLPYFHIGSENYWISGNAGNHVPSFIASLKTGLPLNAVMLSRTSIKETLKNIELVKEPDNIRILEDLKDQRPFLLISSKGMGLNPNEQRLVQKSILIDENSRFRILELKLDSLKTIQDEYEMEIRSKAKKIIESVNGRTPVLFADYNDLKEGMYIASIKDKSYMHEVTLIDTGWYTVSFHAWDMDKDLWPRTRFYIHYCDANDNCPNLNFNFAERIVKLEDGIGLYEDRFHTSNPNQKIKFRYVNKVATNGIMKIDNFLLRKSDEDILQFHNGKYYLNNREVSGIEKESTN